MGSRRWFDPKREADRPELGVFAYLIGGLPAVITLAVGVAGWLQRQERNRSFADRVDLDRIPALSWQEFERRVADVYTGATLALTEMDPAVLTETDPPGERSKRRDFLSK